jgi:hypothetical protein
MRTTRSTDARPIRLRAARVRVAGMALALAASSVLTAGAVQAVLPSAVVGPDPGCGTVETAAREVGTDAFGVGCDEDLRATYRLIRSWPKNHAGATADPGEVDGEPAPDRAATMTAIALAESGGSTGS